MSRRNRFVLIGLLVSAGLFIAAEASEWVKPTPAAPAAAAVDPQPCNDLIVRAEKAGVIRGRPDASTIQVDELAWAELPADAKKGIAMAVRCSAFNGAPGELDGAAVEGFHSGRRLALATSVGTRLY